MGNGQVTETKREIRFIYISAQYLMTRENVGLSIYFDNRMLRILLLGAISGFPWVIIGSALSLWLKDYELSRSTIGWAGLIFSVYAINFI